jgi:hypothetical protein
MVAPTQGQKNFFTQPRNLALLAAALTIGLIGASGGWWFWIKPKSDVAQLRYNSMKDVLLLYGLQLYHHKVKGSYANDLEALLALTRRPEKVRARLASHVDMNTLAVVSEGSKFKIEANVLDGERTLMKIKGPILTQSKPKDFNLPLEMGSAVIPNAGAPIIGAPGR